MRQALWEFSLEQYRRKEVERSCLYWQDQYGVDICLLLAVVWLGRGGHALAAVEIAALQRHSCGWQRAVIRPLRRLRRYLGRHLKRNLQRERRQVVRLRLLAELYSQLKQLELSAERQLLHRLQRYSEKAGWWPREAVAVSVEQAGTANLTCFLSAYSPPRDELQALCEVMNLRQ